MRTMTMITVLGLVSSIASASTISADSPAVQSLGGSYDPRTGILKIAVFGNDGVTLSPVAGYQIRSDSGIFTNYRNSVRIGVNTIRTRIESTIAEYYITGEPTDYFSNGVYTIGVVGAPDAYSPSDILNDLHLNYSKLAVGSYDCQNGIGTESHPDILTILPEPATLSLLAVGGLALLRRRVGR